VADGYVQGESWSYLKAGRAPIVRLASNAFELETPRLLLFCLILFFLAISPVAALDTSWQISQYGHTAWRIQDGFFAGTPNAIAQTSDGYLWIGTQAGLMRFDGVRFVSWSPPEGKELPSSRINSLLGARDGSLWIGTTMGLARWRNGELTNYRDRTGSIMAILEDRDGTIWIARAAVSDEKGPLCQVTDTALRCYGRDDGIALSYAVTLANDSVGNLWLAGGTKVSRWRTNSADTYVSAGLNPDEIFNGVLALAAGPYGSLWVGLVHAGNGGGLQQLAQGKWKPFVTPEFDGRRLKVTALLVDRDSSLWIGTLNRGIYRIQGNNVDHFGNSDGLSGDAVTRLFQDREGNIWIATSSGIDNFHEVRVATFSTRQGLSADQVNAVLASRDGTVWIGNYGLDVLRSGKINSIQPQNGLPGRAVTSLLEDRAGRLWVGVDKELSVYERGKFRKISAPDRKPLGAVRAMAEDVDGSIWAVTAHLPSGSGNVSSTIQSRLFRIQDVKIREEISSPQLPITNTLAPDPHGGVWLGLTSGGLARYRNGQMEFFSFNHSPRPGPVHGLIVNSDGSVLAATTSGLVGWRNGRLQSLTVRNGLPCDVVYGLISDKKATFWLYAACGLIGIRNADLQRWWQSPDARVKSRLLDVFDGARPMSTPFRPNASQSPDGRLWFANQNVVQMIDPAHPDSNPIVPPVRVEEIIGDHKSYAPLIGLRLPALTRDLEIRYTALSFAVPQKVRFRYKLEPHDSEWQDPGTRRQAFYSDLRPGEYRFRVIACNNDGVWNEAGATLAFSLAAAWYQTWWFRGTCAAVFLALIWGFHQLRMHRVQRQEKQLRDVIETVPALAFSTSADGTNEWVNRRWVEYSGLSAEATSGSGWRSAVHPDDVDEHVKKWQSSLATGEPFENEARHSSANGEWRWFLVRAVPLRDANGTILKWYGTLTDIEERKRSEQERERLRQLEGELAHVNRVSVLGELAASLSHELKQPIAAAITNANTCLRWLKRDEPDLEEACAATTRIVNDGNRAAEIINRLRSFYKKGAALERELIDLNDVIRDMLVLLRSEANRYLVSIRTDLCTNLPRVSGDRVQLQQVCLNIMLNGIEAMKDNGGQLTINSELSQDGHVLISVSDTGVGLPAGQADQIFNAFFTTKPEGSGMGLTISRSIIESHGGRLWASANQQEGGATVQFTLPKR
jgi:PAS domain S-box-containing protein